jgi:hypothetical protein
MAQMFPVQDARANRQTVFNIPLNEARVLSNFPPVNTILSPVIAQKSPRMAQMFPVQDARANRQTVFNIPLNEARVLSNFPPVNTANSTEGAWV